MPYQPMCDEVMADAIAGVLSGRLGDEAVNMWEAGGPGERKLFIYRTTPLLLWTKMCFCVTDNPVIA